MAQPLHFEWKLTLKSTPEQLWQFIADTDRLNHDFGLSAIQRLDHLGEIVNNRRHASQIILGRFVQEWIEEPFQWVRPYHYHTRRNYLRGFFSYISQQVDLQPLPQGGTSVHYQIWALPRRRIFAYFIRASLGKMPVERAFTDYDAHIQAQKDQPAVAPFVMPQRVVFAEGGKARLQQLQQALIDAGAALNVTRKLIDYLSTADDLNVATLKPYELAAHWNLPRRDVLETFLLATRVGILDMTWDLLCPHCRGAKSRVSQFQDITNTIYCDVCHIDYEANFEQSVELTFHPNASIRRITAAEFCVGGPEVTPHIIVQQLLQAGETRSIKPQMGAGRYRLRAQADEGGMYIRAMPKENAMLHLYVSQLSTWQPNEPYIQPNAALLIENDTPHEKLIMLEHLAWSDYAVTAADVTTKQVYRDLFSSEALRPDAQIAVSRLTIVFTDLRGSTALYEQIGDAPAFGRVLSHFDVLRSAVREQDGTIVKTIGDAVMAVFRQPDQALRAMLNAVEDMQKLTPDPQPLNLRVGIHVGKCIAVNMNDKLDYFGTNVNIAARLEGQSNGGDIVISEAVYQDPNVRQFLSTNATLNVAPFEATLKGFSSQQFMLYRITENTPSR